jgi:hypothetical protein
MSPITVLDIFRNTQRGEVAILDFAEGKYPRLNMVLKRDDNSTWKVVGMGMGKLSSLTNAYKHLDPERLIYDCAVQEISIKSKLAKGDTLLAI